MKVANEDMDIDAHTKSSKEPVVVYRGHIVSPINEKSYDDIIGGALVVSNEGIILDVGTFSTIEKNWAVKTVYDYGDRLILPGMIDLHLHLPQVTQTGKSGEHLLNWLEKYIFPAESRFHDVEHARKIARWFFDELARNGTTTAVVMTTVHAKSTAVAFEVAAERGNRVIMGKVMMDANCPASLSEKCSDSVGLSLELAQTWHGFDNGRLLYAFTPRFAVTSTAELLKETGKAWESVANSYLHTHLAESQEEVDFVREQFPKCRSYVDVYEQFGLIGKNSVLAHAIHLDDTDLKRLSITKSSLAHCPSSNFFLKSGVFKYFKVREAGVLFGLGSDVAAGPHMSMFTVMKDANYMQPEQWLTATELFYRSTLGGAEAAHLSHVVGSLSAGKEADFIVVDPRKKSGIADDILSQPTDEILSALVFLGDDRLIDSTFVRGKCIHMAKEGQAHREDLTSTANVT